MAPFAEEHRPPNHRPGEHPGDLLLALVQAIQDQNAILDDTIHGELRRIADTHDRIENSLDAIAARLGS